MAITTVGRQTSQQFYVQQIKRLYGDAIRVEEHQITPDVVNIVNRIMIEIIECNATFAMFKILVDKFLDNAKGKVQDAATNALPEKAKKMKEVYDNFEQVRKEGILKVALKKFLDALGLALVHKTYDLVTSYFDELEKLANSDKKFIACINKAKINWRSALETAILESEL